MNTCFLSLHMCSRICKHNYRITIIVKIGYHDHSPAGLVMTGVPLARDDMHSPRATGRPLSIHPGRVSFCCPQVVPAKAFKMMLLFLTRVSTCSQWTLKLKVYTKILRSGIKWNFGVGYLDFRMGLGLLGF